jgi:formylglycine-generating enzyme required for sulfatase activity
VAGQINPAQLITAADLTPGDVTYAYSNTIAAGLALRSDPAAGSEVPASSVVDYVISLGQQSLVDFVYVDDPGVPGHEGFTGFISRNEITNREYCSFLNELYGQGLITVNNGKVYASDDTTYSTAYIETSASSSFSFISFDGTEFTPLRAQHPVTEISWFGAKAYCDYNDFYLPTEWQWQAVADYDGTYVYGCGTSINTLKANYHSMNPLELDDMPFTAPFNYYGQYGYGLYCMTGNVSEWTDWTDPAFSPTVVGGNWSSPYNECQVTARDRVNPYSTINTLGFRVCR